MSLYLLAHDVRLEASHLGVEKYDLLWESVDSQEAVDVDGERVADERALIEVVVDDLVDVQP